MRRSWKLAPDVWLGFAECRDFESAAPRYRWRRDRTAADWAVDEALGASGLEPESCRISRSHTRGIGAAIAAPLDFRVGVDLVPLDRAGPRHAAAILTRREWELLSPWARVRPALGWALKEAAAKAAGEPLGCFPRGLEITGDRAGLIVRLMAAEALELTAGWGLLERFLYAWTFSNPGPVTPRGQPMVQLVGVDREGGRGSATQLQPAVVAA